MTRLSLADQLTQAALFEPNESRRKVLEEAAGKVDVLTTAANQARRALLTGQPVVQGDNTVYPLDGALVGNALDSLRSALAAVSAQP